MLFGSVTRMVHNIITSEMKKVLDSSHELVAVDCTMGNGNDTLFLSKLLGEKGRVYAFDIQEEAISSTTALLKENHVRNVELINDGHEHIEDYVEGAHLCMFNLGYLPKGDQGLVTKPKTTIEAIAKSVQLLKRKGIVSIISYYGHEGGMEEKDAVIEYVSALDHKNYEVVQVTSSNRPNNPPIVLFIRKI